MSRAAAQIRETDPRLALGASFILGVLLWRAGWVGIACIFLPLLFSAWSLGRQHAFGPGLRPMAIFVVLWAGIKLCLNFWDGIPMQAALADAGVLGLRLSALMLLGMVLANGVSARRIGLALSWLLRPVAGKGAWQGALAFALMVNMIPETRRTLHNLKRAQLMRQTKLPFMKRMTVVPLALIRVMARSTWTRAVAVASRGLDNPAAWSGGLQWKSSDTFKCFVLIVFVSLLAIY